MPLQHLFPSAIKLASASVEAAEARSDGSGRGKSSAADAAASALTFRGGPSEQNSITERDLKRRHSSGVYGYHPARSQGHIKAATMARAVQKATHNQRFCLSVIPPTPAYNSTSFKAFRPFALQG